MPGVVDVTRAQWRDWVRRQCRYQAIGNLLLNIPDQGIHRALMAAFEDRRDRF